MANISIIQNIIASSALAVFIAGLYFLKNYLKYYLRRS